VGKNKLRKFSEINTFANVIQPGDRHPCPDHPMRGQWNRQYFRNDHPIILEIGCGKGEYTVGLGRAFPENNFIGIDIKGERLWKGAKEALEAGLDNIAFLRIQAERIQHFFVENEVDAIWLTFPDPQLQQSRERKRLTSNRFLDLYQKILKPDGIIHLKTDSRSLFDYTLEMIQQGGHTLLQHTFDLYQDDQVEVHGVKDIQTYYESMYLEQGLPIHYLQFQLKQPGT
jgi:tRNA (guanine-N7-)-methyltransferase